MAVAFLGIGTIRDGAGRNRSVQIHFPPGELKSGIDAAELAAALEAPLTGRCAA